MSRADLLRLACLTLGIAPIAAGCGGDDGASAGATTAATTGASGTTRDEATSDGATSDGATTAGTSGETSEGTSATTSAAEFCAGWEEAPPPAFLELWTVTEEPLVPGATLPLECGPQGLFMFGLYPRFGGFTPASDVLEFSIVADVEGFNDNPEGHFFSGPVSYYLGCDPVIGGVVGVLPVIPWDEIADMTALDGKAAALHVVMHAPGGDVTVDVAVTLAATPSDGWGFCGG